MQSKWILIVLLICFLKPLQPTEEKPKAWFEKKRIAFIVGVNFYENTSTLKYAVSDAEKLEALFLQVGYYDKIIKLTDKGKVVSERDKKTKTYSSKFPEKNFLPTKKNIEDTFKDLVAEKPDLLLMYFSGHGFISDGKEDKENSLAARDTDLIQEGDKFKPKNGISILELANHTNKEELRTVNLVFLFDACRSDLPDPESEKVSSNANTEKNLSKSKNISNPKETNEPTKEILKKEFHSEFKESVSKEVNDAEGVVMLIGAAPGDSSFEDKKLESGIFSFFLREGISGGIQNENAVEYITVDMAKEYIDSKFEEYAKKNPKKRRQKNYLLTNSRGFRGDFLLTYGRPQFLEEKFQNKMEVQIEQFGYYDTLENRNVFSKLRYSKDWNRKELRFFVRDGRTNKYYPESLEGVYRLTYDITRNPNTFSTESYKATQYNLENKELFTYKLGKMETEEKDFKFEYRGLYRVTDLDRLDNERKNIQYERKVFDKEGRILEEEYFDSKGTKVKIQGITTIKRSFGKITKEEYFDSSGKPALRNGYALHEIEQDENGSIKSESWFDRDKKPILNENGVAKIEYKYNTDNYNTTIINEDASLQITNDKFGISQIVFSYNENCLKNKKTKTLQEALDKKKAIQTWMREGYKACIEKTEFTDKNNKPVANAGGFSKYLFQFDEKGNRIREEKYLNDNRKWIENGVAYFTFAHDENGNIVNKKHFGELTTDNKHHPISDENRVHSYKYAYNQECLKTRRLAGKELKDFDCASEITHFDFNGNPIVDKKGIHKIKIWYDGKNQEEKLKEFYGLNNIYLEANNIKDTKVYDSEGRLILSLFVRNGKSIKTIYTYSPDKKTKKGNSYLIQNKKEEPIDRFESEFNDKGLKLLNSYYKIEDGKEILEEKDSYEYDAKGNMIKHITKKNLSKKTNPFKSIYQSIKSAFIDIEREGIENFDTEENIEYDQNNNILKGTMYYLQMGIKRESYRTEFKYDSQGNLIFAKSFSKGIKEAEAEKIYDQNGNLTLDTVKDFKDGKEIRKSIYKNEYDKSGRRKFLSAKTFENGKEIRGTEATLELEYDDFGNVISETTANGADKTNNSFLRKKIFMYDKSKNPFFFADYSNRENKFQMNSKVIYDSEFFLFQEKYRQSLISIIQSTTKSPIPGTKEIENLEIRLNERIANMPEIQKKEIQKQFDLAKNFYLNKKEKYTLLKEEYGVMGEFLKQQEYKLLFQNKDAPIQKQLIEINLDRFYRPIGISFSER